MNFKRLSRGTISLFQSKIRRDEEQLSFFEKLVGTYDKEEVRLRCGLDAFELLHHKFYIHFNGVLVKTNVITTGRQRLASFWCFRFCRISRT